METVPEPGVQYLVATGLGAASDLVPEALEFVQYLRGGSVAVVDRSPTPPGTVEHLSPTSTVPDDSAPQE